MYKCLQLVCEFLRIYVNHYMYNKVSVCKIKNFRIIYKKKIKIKMK